MISVVIPHWSIKPELDDLLECCVKSLTGYDELIVVVNDGIGFAKAVNHGLRLAKGDFIMVVSNDTVWTEGCLEDLCVPDVVTSPKLNGVAQDFWGCFFVVPRSVYQKIGGLDEGYGMAYYEDDDYVARLVGANVPMLCVESCGIKSAGGQTMKHVDDSVRVELRIKNKEFFGSKWKKT